MSHTYLPNDEILISREPDRPTYVFFSCRMPLGKPDSKSVASHHTQFLTQNNYLFVNTGFIYHLRICSRGLVHMEKQT